MNILNEELKNINVKINTSKTKKIISMERKTHRIKLDDKRIEQVRSFRYLDTILEDNGKQGKGISDRVGKIYSAMKITFLGGKSIK